MGADIGKSLPLGMLAPMMQKAPIPQLLIRNAKHIPKELPLGMLARSSMFEKGGK